MNATTANDVPLQRPDKLYIKGEWVAPLSARQIQEIRPATEEL